MRIAPALLVASLVLAGCGSVDEAPLGGPFGGTTDPTDPNGTTNPTSQPPTDDAGQPIADSGTPPPPAKDSGAPPPAQDSGTQPPPSSAPTWSAIFKDYLAGSTKGRCASCHSQGNSASSLYTWLQGKGYISGKNSAVVDPNQSCLSWYGGNMPPSGPTSYGSAISDMNAWAAAGAANN